MNTNFLSRIRYTVFALLIVCSLGMQLVLITPVQAQEGTEPEVTCKETRVLGEEPESSSGEEKGELPPCKAAPLTALEMQRPPSDVEANAAVLVMQETFEGAFPTTGWTVYDFNPMDGAEYYWDDESATSSQGSWSGWAVGGGAQGSALTAGASLYPNNTNSWMVYGPINLSGYAHAILVFDYLNMSEPYYDTFFWGASHDTRTFKGKSVSGDSGGWHTQVLNLSAYAGDSTVWIGFNFSSDGSVTDYGTFVDWIEVFAYPAEYLTVYSQGKYDGSIIESSENSNVGGSLNSGSKHLWVGDYSNNSQYRSILSFNTGALPDNAVVTIAEVYINKSGTVGTSPFNTHKGLYLDIRKGAFSGSKKLQLSDFQAAASKNLAGKFKKGSSGWYWATVKSKALKYVNKTGTTQFRLRFYKDDNNDFGSDFHTFYSGNAAANKPVLWVQYYIP